eukprot:982652-Pleurochrysis_carterae.AAC.1
MRSQAARRGLATAACRSPTCGLRQSCVKTEVERRRGREGRERRGPHQPCPTVARAERMANNKLRR